MTRSQPAGYFLAAVLLLFYWLPIGWWLGRELLVEGISIPPDFPVWKLIIRTTELSLLVAISSVLATYPFVLLWRLSGEGVRRSLSILMVIPLAMGLLARNYSWIGLLSNPDSIGAVGRAILGTSFLYSQTAVVVVMASVFVPVSFFILLQGVEMVRAVHIDAARTLGAPDWKIVPSVVLPLTYRAALLAVGFSFAIAVGFFVTPRMLGGGKHLFVGNSVLIYVDLGNFRDASGISIAFLAVLLLPLFLIAWYSLRWRHFTSGR